MDKIKDVIKSSTEIDINKTIGRDKKGVGVMDTRNNHDDSNDGGQFWGQPENDPDYEVEYEYYEQQGQGAGKGWPDIPQKVIIKSCNNIIRGLAGEMVRREADEDAGGAIRKDSLKTLIGLSGKIVVIKSLEKEAGEVTNRIKGLVAEGNLDMAKELARELRDKKSVARQTIEEGSIKAIARFMEAARRQEIYMEKKKAERMAMKGGCDIGTMVGEYEAIWGDRIADIERIIKDAQG